MAGYEDWIENKRTFRNPGEHLLKSTFKKNIEEFFDFFEAKYKGMRVCLFVFLTFAHVWL